MSTKTSNSSTENFNNFIKSSIGGELGDPDPEYKSSGEPDEEEEEAYYDDDNEE